MINGFSHKDRVKLALLASFKNKSLLKFYVKETEWFSGKEVDTIQALGGIIKFVNALNISHTSFVEEVKLKEKKTINMNSMFTTKESLLQKNIKLIDRRNISKRF